MRRSLFLLVATVLALVRVFALGFAAVSLGISDSGGASSALLRVFQLYSLFFVYILYLQYRTPETRKTLLTPSIVLACAAPVLSVLSMLALIRHTGDSLPVNLAQAGGSLLAVLALDILVMGLLAIDALKTARTARIAHLQDTGHAEKPAEPPRAANERASERAAEDDHREVH